MKHKFSVDQRKREGAPFTFGMFLELNAISGAPNEMLSADDIQPHEY